GPYRQEWKRRREGIRANEDDEDRERGRKYGNGVHQTPEGSPVVEAAALDLCGRHPLEQMLSRNQLPVCDASYRINHHVGLVREKGQRQRGLSGVRVEIAPDARDVTCPGNSTGVTSKTCRHVRVNRKA